MKQYIDLADQVIDKYCLEMGVKRNTLSQNRFTKTPGSKKLRRAENGISLSFMRQSLAHYLYKWLPLETRIVGKLVGYADHSMVSLYSRIVENHFEVNDPYFMPYYTTLTKVADPMVANVGFERVSAYWFRSVDKKVVKIRSVRKFPV